MTILEFSLDLPSHPDQLMKLSEDYENLPKYLPDQLKSVKIIEKNDGFIIEGPSILNKAMIKSYDDHRIAMTFSIASIISEKDIVINNSECINISFPDFFKTLESIMR